MKYCQLIIGLICGIFFGCIITKNFLVPKNVKVAKASQIREKHEKGFIFTNPLLECLGSEENDSFDQLNISKVELNDYVNKTKTSYGLDTVSVYLRDLNDGPWLGINQDDTFIGGSLLKVPILISYYKLADEDPLILKKVIDYKKQEVDNNQYFASSKSIEVGKKYTVEDLIKYMIYYSDNNAAYLLSQNISVEDFNKVFEKLGLGDPDENKPYQVDVKTYAGFFRILFNASYLSRESSEKALDILSHSEFDRGITASIPKNIIVSHKFGIRSDGNINQLHDCGIVYYPNHPYLLCVMSRGNVSFENIASFISDVSKFIYDKVSEKLN